MDLLEACRKDDFLLLGAHFEVSVGRSMKKQDIKTLLMDKLVAVGIRKRVDLPDSVTAGLSDAAAEMPSDGISDGVQRVSSGGETEVTPGRTRSFPV